MQFGLQEYAFLIITVLFGILLGLFILQIIKRHRSATNLVISLLCGFLACIFAIFSTSMVFSLNPLGEDIFQALQLNVFGLQFFFFFLFLEQLRSKDIHIGRLALMISLFLLQTFSLWLRIYFYEVGEIHDLLWFLSDIGYSTAGLFVYVGCAVPIYIKTYRYTRERKPLIISVALGLIGISFLFSVLKDCFDFFHTTVEWLEPIASYSIAFQALGLFIFTSIYLLDIDYLYRLPNDVFMLMVLTKSGIPLHTVKLKTRRKVEIEGDLLSGLLSAINNVFEELFKTKTTIKNISSKEVHLLMETGDRIVSVVITDKISFFLDTALKRYTREFEKRFSESLKLKSQDLAKYYEAINLIKPIFPFFKVDKVINS